METRKKIIAVDFDGTLCQSAYPNIGKPLDYVIDYVKKLKADGCTLILWTCRVGKLLDEAINWCNAQELQFDYCNENVTENVEYFQNNPRKVYADLYIDDRAVNILDIPREGG